MTDRSGAIHDGTGGYLAEAVLDDNALEVIREANLGFLGLVARQAGEQPAFGLPARVAAAVAALDALGRRAAASCPYTLFSLRFDDAAFWAGVARGGGGGAGSLSDEATFARTAVFLAWHLAQHQPLAAALVLGMPAPVLQAWRGLPLSALDRAATESLPFLSARFAGHPRFWPRLLEAVAPVDRQRSVSVRLLGLQLLAAEGIAPVARD